MENNKTIQCLTYLINFNYDKVSEKYAGCTICYLSLKLQYKEIKLNPEDPLPEMEIVKIKGITGKIFAPNDYQMEIKGE